MPTISYGFKHGKAILHTVETCGYPDVRKEFPWLFWGPEAGGRQYSYPGLLVPVFWTRNVIEWHPCTTEEASPEPPNAVGGFLPQFNTQDIRGLGFTRSAYGESIPLLYGSYKLSGNVFWASALVTRYAVIEDEKIQVATISFAVGFAEGETAAVLRIWVGDRLVVDNSMNVNDDNIAQPDSSGYIYSVTVDTLEEDSPLRGVPGVTGEATIEVYQGSETQLPDVAMLQKEGELATPAYRGLSYIMVRDFVFGPEDGAIPVIYVELLSNTSAGTPRINSAQLSPSVHFTENATNIFGGMIYVPAVDMYCVSARDADDSKVPPGGQGYFIYQGNNLDPFVEIEIREGVKARKKITATWHFSRATSTTGGWVVVAGAVGFKSVFCVFNPVSGLIRDITGVGGSKAGADAGGPAIAASLAAMPVIESSLAGASDLICTVSPSGGSVAFLECSSTGKLRYLSYLNNAFGGDEAFVVPFITSAAQQEATPFFADRTGFSTIGKHFVVFSQEESGALGGIQITLITVEQVTAEGRYGSGYYGLDAGVTIPYSALSLGGYLPLYAVDFIDQTTDVLMIFRVDGDTDRFVRYDVVNNRVKWSIDGPYLLNDSKNATRSHRMLYDTEFGYIAKGQKIVSINLFDGTLRVLVDSLLSAGLTNMDQTDGFQFFNGLEQSIVYTTTDATNHIVKAYLHRTGRTSVGVRNVVSNLLERVGIGPADFSGDDVQALTVKGYLIDDRRSLRTAFGELAQVFSFDVIESAGLLVYKARGGAPSVTVPTEHLSRADEAGWFSEITENADLARKITLDYEDIDAEYKLNVQQVILPKTSNSQYDDDAGISVQSPVVLDAQSAKELAELLLYAKSVYQTSVSFVLPPYYMNLDPSDVIEVEKADGDTETVRLREVSIGSDCSVSAEAVLDDPTIYDGVGTLFGHLGTFRSSTRPPPPGRVDVIEINMPFRTAQEGIDRGESYDHWFACLNLLPNATLPRFISLTVQGTGSFTALGPPRFPTWGYVLTPLSNSPSYATDRKSVLRVKMMNTTGAELASAASLEELIHDGGMNLAWIGGELFQFQTVVDLGGDIYEFRNFNRIKCGTDHLFRQHEAGDYFLLLGGPDGALDNVSFLRYGRNAEGSPLKVIQVSPDTGSDQQLNPIFTSLASTGRPWSPVHFDEAWSAGDLTVTWVQRNRHSGMFADDMSNGTLVRVDGPETYTVALLPAADAAEEDAYRIFDVAAPEFVYTTAMQTEDGFDEATDELFVAVFQVGKPPELIPGNLAMYEVVTRP